MADHRKRRRNEIRRFAAGTAEKLALGAIGFGALRPVFDANVDGAALSLAGSTAFAFVVYAIAIYILRGLEDEND